MSDMADIRFLTHQAPRSISAAVRELWLLEDDGGYHAGLPKPYVELVVSLSGVHWWRAAPASPERRYAEAWVTPVQDGPRYARAVGRRRLIGARLEPWAAIALFGHLPDGDGTPPPQLKSFIGPEARRLRSELRDAFDDEDRFTRFAAWLENRPALRRSTGAGMRSLVAGASATALAHDVRLTPRSLRRRFANGAGLSPKRWLRLRRLDGVLRDPALADRSHSLAQLADAHGYADQAHLSREIARFTGATPTALRRREEGLPPHLLPKS